ncbi:MAG: DUF1996 domain-containing protein [Actinomycetota bacterium]
MKKLFVASMTLAMLLMAAPQPASAFAGGSFLITCSFATFGEFDPLLNEMSHEHTFAGNVGVRMESTYDQLLTQPTNCSFSKDHSAYWVPTFIKNGVHLQPTRVNAYYIRGGVDRVAFPHGYKVKSFDVRYSCGGSSTPLPRDCGNGTAQFNVRFFSDRYPEVHMDFKYGVHSLVGATVTSEMMGQGPHGDMFPAFAGTELERLVRDCLNARKTCGRIKD